MADYLFGGDGLYDAHDGVVFATLYATGPTPHDTNRTILVCDECWRINREFIYSQNRKNSDRTLVYARYCRVVSGLYDDLGIVS